MKTAFPTQVSSTCLLKLDSVNIAGLGSFSESSVKHCNEGLWRRLQLLVNLFAVFEQQERRHGLDVKLVRKIISSSISILAK